MITECWTPQSSHRDTFFSIYLVHVGNSGIIDNSGIVREMSKFTQSINDFNCPFIVYIMD